MAKRLRAFAALVKDQSSVLHGGLQLSKTLVPEDPVPSSGFLWYQACMWYPYIHLGKRAHVYAHAPVHLWRMDDNLRELVLFFTTYTWERELKESLSTDPSYQPVFTFDCFETGS